MTSWNALAHVPDTAWEPVGWQACDSEPDNPNVDVRSRLLATLHLTGDTSSLMMHLIAIEVFRDEEGFQRTVADVHDEELDTFAAVFHPDGGWSTLTIEGREYAVFAEGFS